MSYKYLIMMLLYLEEKKMLKDADGFLLVRKLFLLITRNDLVLQIKR